MSKDSRYARSTKRGYNKLLKIPYLWEAPRKYVFEGAMLKVSRQRFHPKKYKPPATLKWFSLESVATENTEN